MPTDLARISGVPFTDLSKVNDVDMCPNASEINDLTFVCATVPESYEMWAGWSTRRLVSTATTCCRIERLNDNSYMDIGFDSNGEIDIAAAKTFAGQNAAKVIRWHDQSGNNRHLDEGSSADGPLILDSNGAEIELSSPVSKVGLHFNLTDNEPTPQEERMLEFTGSMNGGDWLLLTCVFEFSDSQGNQNIVSQDNATFANDVGEYLEQFVGKGQTRLRISMNKVNSTNVRATNSASSANNTPYLVTPHIYNGSGHEVQMTVDGTSNNGQGSSTADLKNASVLFRVGANAQTSTTNQFKGIMGELVVFSSSNISDAPSSSERTEILNDANDYWNVYT